MLGIACLIIFIILAFARGESRPNYVNSSSAQNFRKVRNKSMRNVSGLKAVKNVKRNCFK